MGAMRQGVRGLLRRPGFTAVAILTLAIGIGATTTTFAIANALFLRDLSHVEEQDRLVTLRGFDAAGAPRGWSWPNVRDLQAAGTGLDILALSDRLVSLQGDGAPASVLGHIVSPNYFRVVGVRAVVGRVFDDATAQEPGAVLSHQAWLTHFAGAPGIVGRTVRINGQPLPVLGVLPEGFRGTFTGFAFDVWVPVGLTRLLVPDHPVEDRNLGWMETVARLSDGLTTAGADATLQLAAERLAATHPAENEGIRIEALPLTGFDDEIRAGALGLTTLLLVVGGLVLVIACANIAGLLLARGAARRRELAVRSMLGADRHRIVGMLLLEAGMLAAGGAVLGILLATWATDAIRVLQPPLPVRLALDFTPDARVIAFACIVTALTVAATGLLPALRATDQHAEQVRAATVVGGARTWQIFVVAQIAGAVLLLVTALLFVRTLEAGADQSNGFDPDGVVVSPLLNLSLLGLGTDGAATAFEEWVRRLEQDPGIESAALVRNVPLGLGGGSMTVGVEGVTPPVGEDGYETRFTVITPDYLDVLRIPLRSGRGFGPADRRDAPQVALVSEAFAGRYWPGEPAVGRRLTRAGRSIEVVGVVRDIRLSRGEASPVPFLYLAFAQWPARNGDVIVRERIPGAGAEAIRREARALLPDLPTPAALPLERHIGISLLPQRVAAAVGGVLGALGALLAGLGVYGLLAFTSIERRREIGVRMAVGAGRREIARVVIGEALRLAAFGIAAGCVGALAVGLAVRSLLHGVSPTDPLAFAAGGALVLAVAVLGCLVPLRRATTTDPMVVLRAE